ncbi:Ldh family oxidoreductase [Limnochorda pilosa]|nr:Ldh family oxidoreductase [Limnochorda pilosa]
MPDDLRAFVERMSAGFGVPEEGCQVLADVLVSADEAGVPSHGVARLPFYLGRVRQGLINPSSVGIVVARSGATALLDGLNGLGPVVAAHAADRACTLAEEHGVGWVGVRGSNHFGIAAWYAEKMARRRLIGIASTNSPPAIAPWGGNQPMYGTNPVAFAFPTRGEPVVVDLSSSVTARGRILQAARDGRAIPEGWALDREGNQTTDPAAALTGSLLPMGGPKGAALALVVEVFTAVLTGATFGEPSPPNDPTWPQPYDTGHLLIALDPDTFVGRESFLDRMDRLLQGARTNLRVSKGHDPEVHAGEPHLPGEGRRARREQARRLGIVLEGSTVDALDHLAQEAGVDRLQALAVQETQDC